MLDLNWQLIAVGSLFLVLLPDPLVGQAAPPAEVVTAETQSFRQRSSSGPTRSAPAVLQPGDAIRLTVWRREELSGEFFVTAKGTLAHPLLDSVEVAGVPLPEVDGRLSDFLLQLEANPEFVVEPLFRVAIGGEVRAPALYRLPPETTIAEAVATAGGATPTGRMDRVRVIRGDDTFVVDVTRPRTSGAGEEIRSGDQILVERRTAIFREYLAPASSVVSALGVILSLILR